MGVVAVTPTLALPFRCPLRLQNTAYFAVQRNEIRVAIPHMRLVLHVSDNTGSGYSSSRATATITSIDGRPGAW